MTTREWKEQRISQCWSPAAPDRDGRVPTSVFFNTPYEQYADRNGQMFTFVRTIDKADDAHDQEVLPMYVIRFADGVEIEAWPEEVGR